MTPFEPRAAGGRLRLSGGRVLDPARGVDEVADLLIEDGRIVGLAPGTGGAGGHPPGAGAPHAEDGELTYDVGGLVVAPGFVDLHCHLREPGDEDTETIACGTRAAAAGGFTTVCAMPDTQPAPDTGADVAGLLRLAQRDAVVRVLPLGTITKRREGRELAELADLAAAGAVAFSDGERPLRDTRLLRRALEYGLVLDRPIGDHAEDADLAAWGVMNEGPPATRLGLPGVPHQAEEVAVARNLALAQLTGGWLHLPYLSTAAAVDLVRRAKAAGVRVTAEVTPHHLTLTEAYVAGRGNEDGRPVSAPRYDTHARVTPPLRTPADNAALLEGLRDGTIDAIATGHSPRRWVDKACEFEQAAPGISALETTFALLNTRLVATARLALSDLIAALSSRPSRAWGLPYGTLAPGVPADVVVLDPGRLWVVDPERFLSLGKHTPLRGEQLVGRVILTLANGTIAYHTP